jgi:CheY-like chemotaxis protein
MASPKTTILVVDDEAFVRMLVTSTLEEAGYRVLAAADGNAGLEWLKKGSVDLMIVDIVMPGKDGVQTITNARLTYPQLRIIAISGDVNSKVYLRAAEKLGAHAALEKPFPKELLLETVKKVLG